MEEEPPYLVMVELVVVLLNEAKMVALVLVAVEADTPMVALPMIPLLTTQSKVGAMAEKVTAIYIFNLNI